MQKIAKEKQFIIKVMPYHIYTRDNPILLNSILEITERPIFLIRKNLDACIQSYYIAKYLQMTGQVHDDWHAEWEEPKQIEFIPTLPKTKSGKIMRRLLKARELGLPEGDTSTLEE